MTPRPSVRWFRDGVEIEVSKDITIEYDEERFISTLEINDCFPENGGSYSCVAVNEAGSARTEAFLEIRRQFLSQLLVVNVRLLTSAYF